MTQNKIKSKLDIEATLFRVTIGLLNDTAARAVNIIAYILENVWRGVWRVYSSFFMLGKFK